MKALSIRQPYSWLIVNGWKDVENRTWRTAHRGLLLIHASKTLHRDAPYVVRKCLDDGIPLPEYVDAGGIVGVVDVVDVVEDYPSRWFVGPFGYVFRSPRSLPFYPLRGRPGVWETGLTLEDILEGGED